jgi:hypothetical protein
MSGSDELTTASWEVPILRPAIRRRKPLKSGGATFMPPRIATRNNGDGHEVHHTIRHRMTSKQKIAPGRSIEGYVYVRRLSQMRYDAGFIR